MKLVDRFWPLMKADYRAAEAYLEAQSKKGLHIKFVGPYGLTATYEKGEPRNIKYCIDIYTGPDEDVEYYQTMLEDAGWNFVGWWDRFLIFASEEKDAPIRINTDSEKEKNWVKRDLYKNNIFIGVGCIFLADFLLTLISKDINLDTISAILLFGSIGMFGVLITLRSILFFCNSVFTNKRNNDTCQKANEGFVFWGRIKLILFVGIGIGLTLRLLYFVLDYVNSGELLAAVLLVVGALLFAIWLLTLDVVSNHCSERVTGIINKAFKYVSFGCVLGSFIIR